jgi:ribonuclease-3 family protein
MSLGLLPQADAAFENPPNSYNSLALAYMGDAVFELLVRRRMMAQGNLHVAKLHQQTVSYVCAHAQSEYMKLLTPLLTEEETDVFKRGRNAAGRVPKNADLQEYRRATGFEALFGWLYLSGAFNRIEELFAIIFPD